MSKVSSMNSQWSSGRDPERLRREKLLLPSTPRKDIPPEEIFDVITQINQGYMSHHLFHEMQTCRNFILKHLARRHFGVKSDDLPEGQHIVALWKLIEGDWVEIDIRLDIGFHLPDHLTTLES